MKRFFKKLPLLLVIGVLMAATAVRVQAQANIYTVAGQNGISGTSGDGGPAISAQLLAPNAFAADARGNYYITDNFYIVRKVDSLGNMTRYAGTGNAGDPKGSGDGGPATDAILGNILYSAADPSGNLYLLGSGPNYASIRKVDAKTGIITTVTSTDGAQPFAAGNLAKNASFYGTKAFTVDANGNLYVAGSGTSTATIYKIDPSGLISVYADLTGQLYEDGYSQIDFSQYLDDMVMGEGGSLYIADGTHSCIFQLTKAGVFTRVAGTFGYYTYSGDGGPAIAASLNTPYGICADTLAHTLYIADTYNSYVRKVDASGTITTIAGLGDYSVSGDGGPAINGGVGAPFNIRLDMDNNLLLCESYEYIIRLVGKRIVKGRLDSIPDKTYGDTDFTLSGVSGNQSVPTFSSDNPAIVTISSAGVAHIAGGGTVTITAHFPALGTDPAFTRSQTVTVKKKQLTVTADDKSITQGDPLPALTLQYSGWVNGDDLASLTTAPVAATTATASSPAGQYPITAGGGVSDNYGFNYISGTLTISQVILQPQTITFGLIAAKTYGDPDFSSGAASDNGTIPISLSSSDPAVATIVNGYIHLTGTGMVTITATQPGNGVYSPAPTVTQSFTVGKALLTIIADDQTSAYGAVLPTLTVHYNGWKNNDGPAALTVIPVATTTATASSPAGQYPINVSGAAAANYSFAYTAGTLTIAPLQPSITFNPLPAKSYSDADFSPGATSSNTLTAITYISDNMSVATITANGLIHITGVGTATITASQSGNGNYNAAVDVPQSLTVNPAVLTIGPDDESRIQGQANPPFTFNYTGLKEGETSDGALLTPPVATTTANSSSYPGIYPITAGGAVAGSHYTISYLTGTLTVIADSTQNADKLETWCSSPTTLQINVFAIANQHATIQLYSLYGQNLVSKQVYLVNANNNFTLPVASLPAGLYVVKVTGQYMKLSQKIRIAR